MRIRERKRRKGWCRKVVTRDEVLSGSEVAARVIAVSFNFRSEVRRLSRMVESGTIPGELCGCEDPEMAQT